MTNLSVQAVPTAIFKVHEELLPFVLKHVPRELIRERMILAVTSKIISLSEGQTVAHHSISKPDLIKREADEFIGYAGHGILLTIKHGLFIASAGIDESNSENGDYILYPKEPYVSARRLWAGLREAWKLKEFGILVTDSRTSPLRQGVTGVALSHWGFRGVTDKVGSQDLFGRELKMTKVNVGDSLAAAAVLTMGEADESQPLAVICGAQTDFTDETDAKELQMHPDLDLYLPLLRK